MRFFVTAISLLGAVGTVLGQLSLPSVPSTLRCPADRADYIAAHFYDGMDWGNPALTDSRAMMQDWANFLSVLPHCHDRVRDSVIVATMHRLPASMIPVYAEMADGYLFATDSELCDETTYLKVMKGLSTNKNIDKTYKSVIDTRLDFLLKNAPGMVATDIEVEIVAQGDTRQQLSALIDKAPEILIVFYDPECEDCHETLETLRTDPSWAQRQSRGDLLVVKAEITEETDTLYPILTVPSLYLLDGHTLTVKKRNLPLDMLY